MTNGLAIRELERLYLRLVNKAKPSEDKTMFLRALDLGIQALKIGPDVTRKFPGE